MKELPEGVIITVAERGNGNPNSLFQEQLVVVRGDEEPYFLAIAGHEILGEVGGYYDRESQTYKLPTELFGQKIVAVENDYLVGERFVIDFDSNGVEFSDPDEPGVLAWLHQYQWLGITTPVGIRTKIAEYFRGGGHHD